MAAVTYGFFAGPLSQVTRTNLIPNPSFETNTTGWAGSNITVTRSSTFSLFGGWALRGVVASTGTNRFIDRSQSDVFVTEGLTYSYSCYVYLPATNTENSTLTLQAFPWRAAGFLAGITLETKTVTRGVWTRLQGTFTAPATTTNCLFRVIRPASWAAGQEIYIDGAILEESPTVLPYFDGTYADPYPDHTLLSQQWNGTTNNSTSTTVWENQKSAILDKNTSFTVTRGRQQVQDPFKAGTATITGLNISTVSGLNIGDTLTIKVVAINGSPVSTTIFNGLIANITADYGFTPEEDRWTIEADDALAAAGRAYTSNSFGAGVTTAIAATLSSSGTFVGVVEPYPTTAASRVSAQTFNNNNLLDIINQLIATEQGRLVASDPLTILFYNRNTQNLFGTLCNFTDGSVSSALPALKYQQIVFRSRAESFFTRTIVEPEGLAAQTAGTGQRTFTMQSYDQTTSQASDLAGYVLATLDVSQDAPSTISYIAENQDSSVVLIGLNAATETLGAQRSLLVTLRGAQYACFVEGSTISADPTRTRFTLNLSSSEAAAGFILDDTILGVLDTSKLGF